MNVKKIIQIIILSSMIFCLFVDAQESQLLKAVDVSKIMGQILGEHVDEKQMSQKILKSALQVYIDQFDPDRVYLLQEEVSPYLNLTDSQMNAILTQYKNNDFSSFTKLNKTIQDSIKRAREYRTEVESHQEELFQKQILPPQDEYSDQRISFAKSEEELKKRNKDLLVRLIAAEKKRFGDEQVMNNKSRVISSFEDNLRDREDHYLGVDQHGNPLLAAQQENLFIMHVIKALASALDAHTSFYNSTEAYDLKVRLEKGFHGIGVILQETPVGVAVTKLVDGGPAAKSGLIKVNDLLIEIDGKPIKDLPLEEVTNMIRGEKGSTISLLLERDHQQFIVKLQREPITLNDERVDVNYDNIANGIIGKITLHAFYQGDGISSEEDVRNAIKQLDQKGNLRGLVLDLRDNSGGFLSQAIKVASLFISNGVVVISKYSNGEEKIYRDINGQMMYSGPLVILTSKATASAAEIVAQALQDYGVAIIVGDERTYGKGTIQSQTVTSPEGSAFFKVTVGKYYTVSGKTPQIQGVKADILVPSQYSHEHIGEEYLEHSLKPDTISAEYNDDLKDIDPSLKSWYMHYYVPSLQRKVNFWRDMLPSLRKNSEYRLAHNKNFQTFLKMINGEKIEEAPTDESEDSSKSKNFGKEDLQMAEAVNIIKDMIYLQSHSAQSQNLNGSSSRVEDFQQSAK